MIEKAGTCARIAPAWVLQREGPDAASSFSSKINAATVRAKKYRESDCAIATVSTATVVSRKNVGMGDELRICELEVFFPALVDNPPHSIQGLVLKSREGVTIGTKANASERMVFDKVVVGRAGTEIDDLSKPLWCVHGGYYLLTILNLRCEDVGSIEAKDVLFRYITCEQAKAEQVLVQQELDANR